MLDILIDTIYVVCKMIDSIYPVPKYDIKNPKYPVLGIWTTFSVILLLLFCLYAVCFLSFLDIPFPI